MDRHTVLGAEILGEPQTDLMAKAIVGFHL